MKYPEIPAAHFGFLVEGVLLCSPFESVALHEFPPQGVGVATGGEQDVLRPGLRLGPQVIILVIAVVFGHRFIADIDGAIRQHAVEE